MRGGRSTLFCVTALLGVGICSGLPPTIGVASALGTFVVNKAQVDGNANLFEGSEIRTGKASSQVFLLNGAALTLGIDSVGTVYRDHLLLQQGATKVDGMNAFSIHAAGYRVEQAQPASQAVMRLDGDAFEIAALAGSLNVFDHKGSLLTRIGAGTASAFQTTSSGDNGDIIPTKNNNNRLRTRAAGYLLLAAVLAGLGLSIATIMQPAPTSPGT